MSWDRRPLEPESPRRQRRRESLAFYGFISPWLFGLVALAIFPLGYAFLMSLSSWDGLSAHWKWVGLTNYARVLTSADALASLTRTLVLAAFLVPFGLIGSLGLAIMLNQRIRLRVPYRTLVYLPSVLPPVAATLVFKLMFNRDAGAVNGILSALHLPIIDWFTGRWVFIVLLIVLAWGVGGGVLLNLAALQDVPAELYDAAKIDGAGAGRSFFAVTLPSISPILLFQVITGTIGAFQTFVPVLLLAPTVAGPSSSAITNVPQANRIYMVEVYSQYFAYNRYGYASAMLWLMTIVILIITAVTFKVAGKAVFYNVDPGRG